MTPRRILGGSPGEDRGAPPAPIFLTLVDVAFQVRDQVQYQISEDTQ